MNKRHSKIDVQKSYFETLLFLVLIDARLDNEGHNICSNVQDLQ